MRRSRAPIRDLRPPPAGLRRRRSGISRRSAAISRSARAAGISAIRISTASRKAASDCPSRAGNHLYGVAFDLGPCVAPHPSTLAAALLAYDATVATDKRSGLSIGELLGDGNNASSDHALQPGEVIKSIQLPPPLAGERAFYKRAISRTYAEWPLVELVVRAVVSGGKFEAVYVAAGGIAPVPLRLTASSARATGAAATAATADAAAKQATAGAKPLPMTGYKLDLLQGLVRDLLERLAE